MIEDFHRSTCRQGSGRHPCEFSDFSTLLDTMRTPLDYGASYLVLRASMDTSILPAPHHLLALRDDARQ
jgi:hypothetical protein